MICVPELLLFMVDVPEFKVKLPAAAKFIGVVAPLSVTVLDPSVIVLTLLLLEDKDPAVTL